MSKQTVFSMKTIDLEGEKIHIQLSMTISQIVMRKIATRLVIGLTIVILVVLNYPNTENLVQYLLQSG